MSPKVGLQECWARVQGIRVGKRGQEPVLPACFTNGNRHSAALAIGLLGCVVQLA